jgi:hypothetical protein
VLAALVLGALVVTFYSRKRLRIEGICMRWKPYTEVIMKQVSGASLFKFRMNRETIQAVHGVVPECGCERGHYDYFQRFSSGSQFATLLPM